MSLARLFRCPVFVGRCDGLFLLLHELIALDDSDVAENLLPQYPAADGQIVSQVLLREMNERWAIDFFGSEPESGKCGGWPLNTQRSTYVGTSLSKIPFHESSRYFQVAKVR